jgi:hypothetical protein
VLAGELRRVVRVGIRAARIVGVLHQLPALVQCCAPGVAPDEPYDQAIAVADVVAAVVVALGNGPYGRAAQALFGVRESSRGLLLAARRREAADELDVELPYFVRHWESRIVEDVAVEVYARAAT